MPETEYKVTLAAFWTLWYHCIKPQLFFCLFVFSFFFYRIPVLSWVLYVSSLMRRSSAFALTFIGLSSVEHTVFLSNQMKKCEYPHQIRRLMILIYCYPKLGSGKELDLGDVVFFNQILSVHITQAWDLIC